MRDKQAAKKEEQQRIKNLVLSLDLRNETDGPDGTHPLNFVAVSSHYDPIFLRAPARRNARLMIAGHST